jgi:hypothetical protein
MRICRLSDWVLPGRLILLIVYNNYFAGVAAWIWIRTEGRGCGYMWGATVPAGPSIIDYAPAKQGRDGSRY